VIALSLVASGCGGKLVASPDDASEDAGFAVDDAGEILVNDAAVDDAAADAPVDGGVALALALSSRDYVAVGACMEVTVAVVDEDGSPVALTGPLDIELRATDELGISLAADCASATESRVVTLVAPASSLNVFARGLAVGAGEVTATSGGLVPATISIEVATPFDFGSPARGALVLHNTNVPGALAIASYYAEQRGIDAPQVCGVALPPGSMATADELLGARRTIVEDCICPLIDVSARPEPCTIARAAEIASVSPITHLVMTKGMPTRLTATGWTLDEESPSLAPFLSYLLYHSETIFGDDSKRGLAPFYPRHHPAGYYPEPLAPAVLGWAAYGQIEATTFDRTRALIDRTLAAERDGFRGTVVVEDGSSTILFQYLIELTGGFADECVDYLTHTPFVFGAPESSWPHERCRVGTTGSTVGSAPSGSIPGELGTTIPNPVGVGLFLGANPGPNTQTGFDGFDVMRRWHRAEPTCTELCDDHGTREEILACRERSLDLFGELDTDCVGAAPGFLAYQTRSWPVQYMGFFPNGWMPTETGSSEKDAPRIMHGDAYRDTRFTDDVYVRFGGADFEDDVPAATAPRCRLEDGTTRPCPERVVTSFGVRVPIDPPLPFIGGQRTFTVRMRYRSPASPGGALEGWAVFDGVGTAQWEVGWTFLEPAHPSWTLLEFSSTADQARLPGITTLDHMRVVIITTPEKPGLGFLDLDGVEVIDDVTGRQLLDPAMGSFAHPEHRMNVPGDFASNVIDRLGGIGAWGSTSHFVTGGWAFRAADRFAPMLFSGRTLGEALLASERPQSGLVYADPLYRPAAVRLRADDGSSAVSVERLDGLGPERFLTATAMLGSDHAPTLEWSIAACEGDTISICERDAGFVVQRRGVGAVDALPIDWSELVALSVDAPNAVVRLAIWRAGEEDQALSSYVRIAFTPRG